ncbi:hypothetical protein NDQ50_12245 [Lactiplantibacillus plantarum]|nr:hypothetical protein [Lactiplantibacillus plantarum]
MYGLLAYIFANLNIVKISMLSGILIPIIVKISMLSGILIPIVTLIVLGVLGCGLHLAYWQLRHY